MKKNDYILFEDMLTNVFFFKYSSCKLLLELGFSVAQIIISYTLFRITLLTRPTKTRPVRMASVAMVSADTRNDTARQLTTNHSAPESSWRLSCMRESEQGYSE